MRDMERMLGKLKSTADIMADAGINFKGF